MDTDSENTPTHGESGDGVWPPAIEDQVALPPAQKKVKRETLTKHKWLDTLIASAIPPATLIILAMLNSGFIHLGQGPASFPDSLLATMFTIPSLAGLVPWPYIAEQQRLVYPALSNGFLTGTALSFGLILLGAYAGMSNYDHCGCSIDYIGNTISLL